MLKTPANPDGTPIDTFDRIRGGVAGDRAQFFRESQLALLWLQPSRREGKPGRARLVLADEHAMRSQGRVRMHQGILRNGFHVGPRRFDVPTLLIHGDDDQIVPIAASALSPSS